MLTYIVSAKYKNHTDNHPNCFPTLSDALAHIPADTDEQVTIMLKPGLYHEKVTINRPYVTIQGEDAKTTTITWDDYANALMPDGSKMGTFRSYTMFLDSHDITLSNITVQNASGPRAKAGQAIALYADGDRIIVEHCRLESHQDTLFTGPLPPTVIQPGGFVGPKEFSPRINGRQFYKNCFICGDIDFIFGSATAYFEDCELYSLYDQTVASLSTEPPLVCGYVTAASTPEGQDYGYVFSHCLFTGNCPKKSVFLGRPWRNYAKTVILNCELERHIHPQGFHDWNKPAARDTCFYGEYQNTGDGADPNAKLRAPFIHHLSSEEAYHYTKKAVLAGDDNWYPD